MYNNIETYNSSPTLQLHYIYTVINTAINISKIDYYFLSIFKYL